jgi:MFS family permease
MTSAGGQGAGESAQGIDYAWWVLLGLLLLYTATNGILLNTLPLMYPSLTAEFGWNEEQVTRPAALFLFFNAALNPVLGAFCDRYPARRIMVFGVALIVGSLLVYAYISSLTQMTLVYLVCSVGLAAAGLVPNMLILSRWFDGRRGLAVGILLMGSSLGGALFPLIVKPALVDEGWRAAVTLIAMVGGAMMILGLLLVRNERPGAACDEAAQDTPAVTGGLTLQQAMRMPAFYMLMVATGSVWFCITGTLQHQSIYLGQDLGLSSARLPVLFSVFFWCAIIGKLLFGWLGDHFNKVWILLASVLNMVVGIVLLRSADPEVTASLYAYAMVYGVGFAGAFSAMQLVLAEFYAGASYGRILGVFIMIDSFAGAAGIQFLGLRRVADGSYLPGLNILIALMVLVAVLLVILRRYEPDTPGAVPS